MGLSLTNFTNAWLVIFERHPVASADTFDEADAYAWLSRGLFQPRSIQREMPVLAIIPREDWLEVRDSL